MVGMSYCDFCANLIGLKEDGHTVTCKAFPNGIPLENFWESDRKKIEKCNVELGFSLDESKRWMAPSFIQ